MNELRMNCLLWALEAHKVDPAIDIIGAAKSFEEYVAETKSKLTVL